MFRGINLCGAEVNTKFSEQHRTHLLHSHIIFIIISSPLVVKSARPSSALTLKFILTLSEYIGFYFLILLYQRNLI